MVFVRSFAVAAIDTIPRGITTDGKYLWWIGATNKIIVQMDKAGNLIRTIAIGAIDTIPQGIITDGKYLWWIGRTNAIIVQWAK